MLLSSAKCNQCTTYVVTETEFALYVNDDCLERTTVPSDASDRVATTGTVSQAWTGRFTVPDRAFSMRVDSLNDRADRLE